MQRFRAVILIVLFGILPVGVAFFAAVAYLKDRPLSAGVASALPAPSTEEPEPSPPPPPPVEMSRVLVAARDLPVGTLIREEDLGAREIALDAVRKDHIVVDDKQTILSPDRLHGHAARTPIASGDAILRSALVGPGQRGFLAAVLSPGARAVTIRVGAATRHAGLIDPGDRVDVILSAMFANKNGERSSVLARTIVEDVRVVAVNRTIGDGGGPVEGPRDEKVIERTEMITATLEVTPTQGDRLVLGEHEGKLSLAVRPLSATPGRAPISAVDLQDLLLSPGALEEANSRREAERLRQEVAALQERLRREEKERLRREEEAQAQAEAEERKRREEERKRLRATEAERQRLARELAAMEGRLQREREERLRQEEEEERKRREEEERLRREAEQERLRVAEAERQRLARELTEMKERLEAQAQPPPEDTSHRTVRVFRGHDPAQEVLFADEN